MAAGALALPACATQTIPPTHCVADLYAIHAEEDWSPRTPARMYASPASYEMGFNQQAIRVTTENTAYEVEDHRALELLILDRIAEVPPLERELALEASASLIVELLHDDYQQARLRSATILSGLAGAWVDRAGIRLVESDPEVDLAAAVEAFNQATNDPEAPDHAARVEAALARLDRAPVADPLIAARLLAGLNRRMAVSGLQVTGSDSLLRLALRCVLTALAAGAEDPDPEVAEYCRERHDLILRFATQD